MAAKTIFIKNGPNKVQLERLANAGFTPGQLVEIMSTNKFRKHATAGGNAIPLFAVEDENQGAEINTDYVAASLAFAIVAQPGDEVFAFLKEGETAAIGSFLESDGAGDLQVHVADISTAANTTNQIVAMALEAVDLSGSSGADPATRRITCLVL